jgi:hypothetical protein
MEENHHHRGRLRTSQITRQQVDGSKPRRLLRIFLWFTFALATLNVGSMVSAQLIVFSFAKQPLGPDTLPFEDRLRQ